MPLPVIADLRSDTFTRPGPEMRAVMAKADVGDDVFGEDPTISQLEEEVSDTLGFEAAMFVPSGTMANQIAINLHTRPGDSVLIEEGSHVCIYEAGAAAVLSGIQFDALRSEDFMSWNEQAVGMIREDNLHSAPTRLIVVENTHNRQGGRVMPQHTLQSIRATRAARPGLALHCDGARIWNAAVACGMSERELLAGFDSASVCFSKGLGAPVGSALCGEKAFIAAARKVRKRWGGGMRQAGIIAAGALFAFREHRDRLFEDHEKAKKLTVLLAELRSEYPNIITDIRVPTPQTNMLYFRVSASTASSLVSLLAERGILVLTTGGGWIRAVTHLDIPAGAMPGICAGIRDSLSKL